MNQILTNSIARGRRLVIVPLRLVQHLTAQERVGLAPQLPLLSACPNTATKYSNHESQYFSFTKQLISAKFKLSVEHFVQELEKLNQ
jgi:CRP-like cAMP-binding protein